MDKFPKILLTGLSIIVFSSTFSILIIEVILQSIHFPQNGCPKLDEVSENAIAEYNSVLGWSYIPYRSTVSGNQINYIFNKEGYRVINKEYKTDFSKPIILIVGDSMLFGHGIQYEETFGYKLKQKLNNAYEVINFSVQGYGTDQIYLALKKLLPIYKPKVVITDYIDEHIMRNVSRDRREFLKCSRFVGTKPLFKNQNGQLVLSYKPQQYGQYDNPRIILLLRRALDGDLRQRAERYGRVMTLHLIDAIDKYVKANNSSLFFFNINSKESLFKNDLSVVNFANYILGEEKGKYLISATDPHPNSEGTSLMVDLFLEQFNKKNQ